MESRTTTRPGSIILVTSLAQKPSSKTGAAPLTASTRRPPSVLLWSSSFDHLSHPVSTSPFSSQKKKKATNSEQSVNLSGWEATNANVKNREYIPARAARARTHPLKTHSFVKTQFREMSDVCVRAQPFSRRQRLRLDGGVASVLIGRDPESDTGNARLWVSAWIFKSCCFFFFFSFNRLSCRCKAVLVITVPPPDPDAAVATVNANPASTGADHHRCVRKSLFVVFWAWTLS